MEFQTTMEKPSSEILELDVSGQNEGFKVSKSLLNSVPNSKLAQYFSGDHEIPVANGKFYLDRNPTVFGLVLDYLRNDRTDITIEDSLLQNLLEKELNYWKLKEPETTITQETSSAKLAGLRPTINTDHLFTLAAYQKVWAPGFNQGARPVSTPTSLDESTESRDLLSRL